MQITSLTNSRIKEVLRLRKSNERLKNDQTIVEGDKEILCALKSEAAFQDVFVCPMLVKDHLHHPIIKEFVKRNLPIHEIGKDVLEKISYGNRRDGFLALCRPKWYTLNVFGESKHPELFVVLEAVEKPGNLGAVLRTTDAVGADGIIVCDQKTDLFNPNIIRSSIGTVFTQKVVSASNADVLKFFQERKVKIYAALPESSENYTKMNFKESAAIILGSEDKGLSVFWKKNADRSIKLPMKGLADSLNVSITAAVVLYEAFRQREH